MEIGTVVGMASITDYSRSVAGNVKAELARRDLSGSDIIPVLGISRNAVYDRLRAKRSFEVNELALIAEFLDIDVSVLMATGAPRAVAAEAVAA